MNYDAALNYIQTQLKNRRAELEAFLGAGAINDIAEYKRVCGVIQGLDFAEGVILDLAQRLETDADE